ncbi:uncharacterized protein FIBRA_09181 [Fibroporia radiculosa]|uniref:Uncharacterized protein n=1 Tax=Fibroporia radiculosa TaxID=599839 RepID=J4GJ32_9APHY|nr:uncharacterized protein FIBRA_09181 [Fibroporia radiculosa]CCM06873.1 predicted protein [Fibroporia radiculosa]
MASTTLLVTLLILSWFFIALLILILVLAVFFIKETYTFKINLERNPTPINTPIAKQALNWANNGVQSLPSPPSPLLLSMSTPTSFS